MLLAPELPVPAETHGTPPAPAPLNRSRRAEYAQILLWVLAAAAAFHAAYASAATSCLVIVYLFALVQLAQASTWRKAFYPGLAVGLLLAAGRLEFFWRIFSGGAIALWLVYAFWVGLFTALARLCLRSTASRPFHSPRVGSPAEMPARHTPPSPPLEERAGERRSPLPSAPPSPPQEERAGERRLPWGWLLLPFLWCGLEYFRSELYYLRFAWLSPGFAFGAQPAHTPLSALGTYGLGFLLMSLACAAAFCWSRSPRRSLLILGLGLALLRLWPAGAHQPSAPDSVRRLHVAGVQMEFPTEDDVLVQLNGLLRKYPDTELCVLSEYTFAEPIPKRVKEWCRKNQRYLIVGGEAPIGNTYYNSAFVISPAGEIVFQQAKSVPIQFFKDGLPAPEQKVWDSPWGKLGICICYDLSYSRVTDRLIRLGAQAIIVPTMDVAEWGERQHHLHARVAPLRAAEYRVPIFRLASSGISQAVDRRGTVLASTTCPGDGDMLAATLELRKPGTLPADRWLAPFATGLTGLVLVGLALTTWRKPRAGAMKYPG